MNIELSPSFDQHEHVAFLNDDSTGLNAIIAIHNTRLGPAVGGCRMFPYQDSAEALEDVLRLSRGMTYKSAVAGLPMGGGKAVIIGDPAKHKSPALLAKMGAFIDSLNGQYVSAEDSGTSVADLRVMATCTDHVLGVSEQQEFGGDPSPLTALGIFHGIQASITHRLGAQNFNGVHVAVQGVGAVGYHLSQLLIEAGARVSACDVNAVNLAKVESVGAKVVPVSDIITLDADVFAPCAMGAVINDRSVLEINAPIVAGGANNQLECAEHAEKLRQREVLYAPDFVINAGGIIEICRQYENTSIPDCKASIEKISSTLSEIFTRSDADGCATNVTAERLAEQRFSSNARFEATSAA